MMLSRRLLMASVTTVVLVVAFVSVALAHAEFVSSIPAPKSTVASVPSQVKGTYSEGINPQGSSITVTGPNGARADRGDGHVDLNDPSRQTMLVSLKSGLGPGTYTVNWTTVSADDGDTATGSFSFTVASAASAAASTVTATLPKTGGLPLALPIAGGIAVLNAGVALRRHGH